jgi:hypothetical protein
MIVELLGWLALAELIAAAGLAGLVYIVGRKSGHPVAIRSVVFLAIVFAIPALLFYAIRFALQSQTDA